ncbi:WD40 repeat-like protein [Wallemia mellicola]|uniref:WD40 repeat-like protein n=1 Tax=Wallemia mellicola TaxID=1708541 RepID=A0A4T0PAW3_9BASI|nr:hypothetical protein E3Q24_00798 [Wallemia mellicola]TIB81669.1 WD40 repeat-like protein [Wallemia mellicola]TIB90897.1 WD40 repeat-like protein [Wallemia mellicola]TIB92740.1 WD40 repeat-like protein [Wallemia mellicola]TIB99730.1 WD40 repeat-like protein [Wallemia mellicola]
MSSSLPPLKTKLTGHNGPVNVVKFNNQAGRYCLSGGRDRSIRLWNPHLGSEVKTYQGHGWEVLGLSITQDNTHFASCGGDKSVFLWDVQAGAVVRRFSGHNSKVNSVAFNHDGSVLASGSYDSTVRLWDMRARQRLPLQILDDAKDSVVDIHIAGDRIFTASVDGYLRTYDLRAGQLRQDFLDYSVTSVTPTADRSAVLVATLDNKVRLIDSATGSLLALFEGHTAESFRARSCLGSGEATVLCTSEDGRLFLWDLLDVSKT